MYEASDFYKETKDTNFVLPQKLEKGMRKGLIFSIFMSCSFIALSVYHLFFAQTDILLAIINLLMAPFIPFLSFYMATNVAMIGEIRIKENRDYDRSSWDFYEHRFIDALFVNWCVYGLRVKIYYAVICLNMLIAFVLFGNITNST